MSFTVRFLGQDGKCLHTGGVSLRPLSMSWSALGGCDSAEISVQGDGLDIADWQGYLAKPVEIVDELGRLRWWGWLESVKKRLPGMRLGYDLAKMANRVAVVFDALPPDNMLGEKQQTAWVDDAESQALYGIKERVLLGGSLTLEQAEHWRDAELRRWRLPVLQAEPTSTSGNLGLVLSRKGWMHRLDWRVWQRESGVIANTVSQSGVQAVGADLQNAQIAQSFIAPRAVHLSAIQVRLRKQGLPVDKLRVDIKADQAGSPATGTLASCSLDPSELNPTAYAWVRGVFPAQISLTAGNRYWFVIRRLDALDSANHCLMVLDENLSFPHGEMKLFNQSEQSWQVRVPPADALFKLTVLSRIEDEIAEILQLATDFLTGSDLEASIGLRLPVDKSLNTTLLQALRNLLSLDTQTGDRLLMEISPDRFLRICAAPEPSVYSLSMDDTGELFDRMGRALAVPSDAVGKYVGVRHGKGFLVREMRLDLESGRYQLKTF